MKAYRCPRAESRDRAKLALASANKGALVQAARWEASDNASFLAMLAAQTFLAESSGTMLARKREMDFLLRLAGTTQISEAIREMGAKEGEDFLAVVAGGKEPRAPPGFEGERLPERQLTREEYARVEAAALLSVEKA